MMSIDVTGRRADAHLVFQHWVDAIEHFDRIVELGERVTSNAHYLLRYCKREEF